MSKGILYVATGDHKYVEQALISKRSIERFDINIDFAIYTDLKIDDNNWNTVIEAKHRYRSGGHNSSIFVSKLDGLIESPFESTLFLDTDTFVLKDLSDVFNLLRKFDFVYSLSHYSSRKDKAARGMVSEYGKTQSVLSEVVPESFFPVQGGVFLYNRNKCRNLLNLIKEKYIQKKWWDDQVSVREALWETEVQSYVLPQSYNFSSLWYWIVWKHLNFQDLMPTIWHYTGHKSFLKEFDFYRIEKILNEGNRFKTLLLLLKLKFLNKS